VANGKVGSIDGMDVVSVPDSYFPAGVYFIIKFIDATVDPLKIKVLRVQKNPVGLDGDVGECRFYHDSFVLDAKVNGMYIYGNSSTMPDMPTYTGTSSVTIACTNATTIKYTTDGTNPKASSAAQTYSSAVSLAAGQTLKAYGSATGYVNSPVQEYTRP
jgi:hypothetical protein